MDSSLPQAYIVFFTSSLIKTKNGAKTVEIQKSHYDASYVMLEENISNTVC